MIKRRRRRVRLRLPRSERGSVSVYGVIAMLGMMVLLGVLIDTVRIQMAGMQTERALKTSLRSTLASFDPDLLRYGLFGTTATAAAMQKEAEATMKRNLGGHLEESSEDAAAGDGSPVSMLDTKLERFGPLSARYPLADHGIFERQILEAMKFRAPIEFARSIAEPFSGLTPALAAAQTFQLAADTLENRVQDRERLLDDAWATSLKLQAEAARTAQLNEAASSTLGGLAERMDQASAARDALEAKPIAEDEEPGERERQLRAIDAEIVGIYDEMERVRAASVEQTIQAGLEIESLRAAAGEAVSAARQQEADMEAVAARSVKDEKLASIGAQDAFSQLPLHGQEYYDRYMQELASAGAALDGLQPHVSWEESYTAAIGAAREAEQFIRRRQPIEQERMKRTGDAKRRTNEAREKGKAMQQQVREARQAGCAKSDHQAYARLALPESGLYPKYIAYNEQLAADKQKEDPLAAAPESGVRQILGHSSRMQSFLLALRDELYVNEYALSMFNYRTIGFDLADDKAERLSSPDTHRLDKQEAEYILYGAPNCELNLIAAYGEIFLFRTAVRTAEALADPQVRAMGAGSPMLMFASALLAGLERAVPDTADLMAGKTVPLGGKWVSLPWSYKDHLRLFYLIHSGDIGMMSRMQALIELNEGVDLTRTYTYVAADASASVKLWFLPGAAGVLNTIWQEGGVKGGRLGMQRTAHLSYH